MWAAHPYLNTIYYHSITAYKDLDLACSHQNPAYCHLNSTYYFSNPAYNPNLVIIINF